MPDQPQSAVKTSALTGITLVAFAANSILCRAALQGPEIDPLAFTSLRLTSGAVFLALLVIIRNRSLAALARPKWRPSLALFFYAIAFSLAYVALPAGTGALLLFASVQVTMIGLSLIKGERMRKGEWLGAVLALVGLIYLLSPGLAAPPLLFAGLMILSGIGWGLYSLYGKVETDPITATARNFLYAVPFALVLGIAPAAFSQISTTGVILAIASGAIASGMGYVVWYAALRGLSAMEASIVQLAVPVVAAVGGILFLGENLTLRFALASLVILGGILITILAKNRPARSS
ncbi:MAG: DMT family transporter [Alphaproteobacteria bacterium]|nr:MAG: DMT family transporter [Alphaproteobacteria bacterium]